MLNGFKVCTVAARGLYPKIQNKTVINVAHKRFSVNNTKSFTTITKNKIPQTFVPKRTVTNENDNNKDQSQDEPTFENLITKPMKERTNTALIATLALAAFLAAGNFMDTPSNVDEEILKDAQSNDQLVALNAYKKIRKDVMSMMRHSPKLIPLLVAGLTEKDLIIQSISFDCLYKLALDTRLSPQIADQISWSKVASVTNTGDYLGTLQVASLMHALAMNVKNAGVLVDNNIIPLLDVLLRSGNTTYVHYAIHTLAALSRTEKGASSIVGEVPEIYKVIQSPKSDQVERTFASEALSNILKKNQDVVANVVSDQDFKRLAKFSREPRDGTSLSLTSLLIYGTVAATLWGTFRWTLTRRGDVTMAALKANMDTLKVRVPITVLGTTTLLTTSYFFGGGTISQLAFLPVFFGTLVVAPYSVAPAVFAIAAVVNKQVQAVVEDPKSDWIGDKYK